MIRPICVPCGVVMRVEKNDEVLGIIEKKSGRYLETVHADRWKCPECEHQIWSDFGKPYFDQSRGHDVELKW